MLNDRKKRILQAIVDEYVDTAEPVSSGVISQKHGIDFSSATIRNEMAELEEIGFLDKPHTSAGRVPSQSGYRYYIDELLRDDNLTTKDDGYFYVCKLNDVDNDRLYCPSGTKHENEDITSRVNEYKNKNSISDLTEAYRKFVVEYCDSSTTTPKCDPSKEKCYTCPACEDQPGENCGMDITDCVTTYISEHNVTEIQAKKYCVLIECGGKGRRVIYRVIDLDNPFPSINGNGRGPGSNW